MEETQTPLQVSVLLVSYNAAEALRRSLRALESASARETFEVIVVDNGSLDESPTLDAEFPAATFLRLPRNFGFTKAVNIAMRTAKAPFFFLLSPGIEVQPNTVTQLAAQLEQAQDAVAVCPLVTAPAGEPAPELYRLPGAAAVAELARAAAFTPAPPPALDQERVPVEFAGFRALMVRGYFLKGLRYIDERYAQAWADAEIAAQIRRASRKILLLPGVRVVFAAPELPPYPPKARALLAADWVLGASTYAGKYFGFAARLKIRIAAVLRALGAVLGLRDFSYNFARLSYLLSGQKLDGTQRVL